MRPLALSLPVRSSGSELASTSGRRGRRFRPARLQAQRRLRPDRAREQWNSFHSFRASSRSPAEIEGRGRTSFADHGGNGRAATDLPWEVDQPRSKTARGPSPFKPLESKELCPGAKVEPGPRGPALQRESWRRSSLRSGTSGVPSSSGERHPQRARSRRERTATAVRP